MKRILLILLASLPLIGFAQLPQVIGTGPGPIHALAAYDDSLFIAGSFITFNGQSTWYSCTYDGSIFNYHSQLLGGSGFRDFLIVNDTLWGMGSELSSPNMGNNDHVNSIAYRDSGVWKGHNKYSVNNTKDVFAMTEYNGELIMGGNFTVTYPYVARHDGNNYMPLGAGFNSAVNGLAVYNGELYAAGVMSMSGSTSSNNVAKWNGTSWDDVAGGTDFNVFDMEVWNGELYIAGTFTTAGGMSASRIAKWDGSTWEALGAGFSTPMNGPCYVNDLCATSNGLMIGGRFELIDGVPGNNLARWDGTSLTPVGNLNVLDEVQAIGEYQGELYFSTFRFGLGAIGKLWGPGSVGQAESDVNDLLLFPNPSNGDVTISSDKPIERVLLVNALGKLVEALEVRSDRAFISGLSSGYYVAAVEQEGRVERIPFVVE